MMSELVADPGTHRMEARIIAEARTDNTGSNRRVEPGAIKFGVAIFYPRRPVWLEGVFKPGSCRPAKTRSGKCLADTRHTVDDTVIEFTVSQTACAVDQQLVNRIAQTTAHPAQPVKTRAGAITSSNAFSVSAR